MCSGDDRLCGTRPPSTGHFDLDKSGTEVTAFPPTLIPHLVLDNYIQVHDQFVFLSDLRNSAMSPLWPPSWH